MLAALSHDAMVSLGTLAAVGALAIVVIVWMILKLPDIFKDR